MATNGGAAKENGAVDVDGTGGDAKDEEIAELKRKIEGLEKESAARAEQLESLRLEIARLEKGKAVMEDRLESARRELEQSEDERKALRAVANRAAVLEGDVSQLQHDLVTSMSVSEETSAEVAKLKASAEGLRRSSAGAESRVRVLEEKLAQAESEKAAALSEISANDSDIVTLKRDLKDLMAESSGATVKCAQLQSELDDWRMQYSMLLDEFEMKKMKDGEEGQSGSFPWSGSVMAAASAGVLAVGIAGYFLCAKKR